MVEPVRMATPLVWQGRRGTLYKGPIVNEVVTVPRLFVALDLPQAVKRSLEPLAKGLGDVRWLAPEQQHLTLRFIGDVDNGALHDIAEALATVPARPFELTLKGLGHFPPRGEPRVLWVGVDKNPELASLKRRIDRALKDAGLPPDARKFAPHVTIARMRGAALADPARHVSDAAQPVPERAVSGQRLPSVFELAAFRRRRTPDRG